MGVLLALSPTLWFVSRAADGAILAWTLAAIAFFAWINDRRVLASALLGILAACGFDAPIPLVITVSAMLLKTGVVVPSRRMSLACALAFLAGATALLLRPSGLGDALNGVAVWLQRLREGEVFTAGRLLLGLATNEVVVTVGALFGLGALFAWRRLVATETTWLAFIVLGFVALFIDAGRTASALVPIIIGCAGLASYAYERLLANIVESARLPQEGVIAGMTFVLVLYAGLGLRQYAGQGQTSWLFPIVIAALLILAIIAAGSLGLEYSTAVRGTAAGMLASMLLYALGVGLQLNHARLDNPAEPYRAEATLTGVSTLQETLSSISLRATGEPLALAINLPDTTPAAVRWALRDQRKVDVFDVRADATLTAAQNKPASGNYIGVSFNVTSSVSLANLRCQSQALSGLDCLPFARWLAFRTADDVHTERWVLWLRNDVAAKAGGRQ